MARKTTGRSRRPFDKDEYPNCYDGHQYAMDVLSGEIPANKTIIGACQRYLNDLAVGKYPFDPEKAERFLRLVQRFEHVKGEWKTKNIVYEPWQKWAFMNIMGFQNPATNYRRFRTAHLEVPRGNAKSVMASQAALFFLALDNPKGNEISCFATKSDQARIVLDSARSMARKNQAFLNATGVEVLAHKVVHADSDSFVRAMSSDSKSLDGLNDILACIDELHAVDRSLFDVVNSGLSKRKDSLLLCITTAGFDETGVGFSQSVYAQKVATGEIEDDTFFAAVYGPDEGDDVYSELTWKKANPNYGISVDPVTFEAKAIKTRVTPADLPNFKTKHLNIWVSGGQAFFSMAKWDACKDETLNLEDFRGERCRIGLDLASKVDLTSKVKIFKRDGIYYIFANNYMPAATLLANPNDLFKKAEASGHLISTPGEAIHYPKIEEDIVTDTRVSRVLEVLYDPWQATQMAQNLQVKNIPVTEFRFNTSNLSEPTKTFDALIREGKIRHNGDPVLRFCMGNVVCKEDAAGNVFPKKHANSEHLKIDSAIAAIMGIAGFIQEEKNESVYNREERGLRFI